MKRLLPLIQSRGGFTLVEIIVTVIAAAILGYIFSSLMGTAIQNSWKSVDLVAGEADAEATMNEILSNYVEKMNSNPDSALGEIETAITNGEFGTNIDTQYIFFDGGGNEQPSGPATDTLKVTVRSPGKDFVTLFTKSRNSYDPIVKY